MPRSLEIFGKIKNKIMSIIDKMIDKGFNGLDMHNFCRKHFIFDLEEQFLRNNSEEYKKEHYERLKKAEIELDFTNYKK